MGISNEKNKWKTKGPANARMGTSSTETASNPGIESKESLMGNTSLSGYASIRPKQGKRS